MANWITIIVSVIISVILVSILFISIQRSAVTNENVEDLTCNVRIVSSKPGACPSPNNIWRCVRCIESCTSDDECPGEMKCCPQPQCGNSCKDPASSVLKSVFMEHYF